MKTLEDVPIEYAGAPCYVTVTVSICQAMSNVCACQSQRGIYVRIEVLKILAKDRKRAPGYYTAKAVKEEALRHFRDKQYLCFDCLQQPPFSV